MKMGNTFIQASRTIGRSLLDILFPRFCPICGETLQLTEKTICSVCDLDLPRTNFSDITDNRMLRTLWSHAAFTYATSFMYYCPGNKSNELVISIKYRGGMLLAVNLGRWAAQETEENIINNQNANNVLLRDVIDGIIPVPITRKRMRQRGYNQASAIAEGISEHYGIPCYNNMLMRIKETISQTKLHADDRLTNMKESFHAEIPQELRGKHFLIVDDVMTTGATLSSCANALLKSDPDVKFSAFTLALDAYF